EQVLFARLSVFAGGCGLEAITAVCDIEADRAMLDHLDSLVEKSIVQQLHSDGEPRFVLLETIREYAQEILEQTGEADRIRERYWTWAVHLAEQAEPHLRSSRQTTWFQQLESEH